MLADAKIANRQGTGIGRLILNVKINNMNLYLIIAIICGIFYNVRAEDEILFLNKLDEVKDTLFKVCSEYRDNPKATCQDLFSDLRNLNDLKKRTLSLHDLSQLGRLDEDKNVGYIMTNFLIYNLF
ncbi:hypothetical protein ACFL5V_09345, partial [Fibrobacterota bacterium]